MRHRSRVEAHIGRIRQPHGSSGRPRAENDNKRCTEQLYRAQCDPRAGSAPAEDFEVDQRRPAACASGSLDPRAVGTAGPGHRVRRLLGHWSRWSRTPGASRAPIRTPCAGVLDQAESRCPALASATRKSRGPRGVSATTAPRRRAQTYPRHPRSSRAFSPNASCTGDHPRSRPPITRPDRDMNQPGQRGFLPP